MRRLSALLVAAALTVTACTANGSPRATVTHSPKSASTPSRILPVKQVLPQIEAFVEHERGLKFKHPVKAVFLGRKAFIRMLNKHNKPPSALDIEKLQSTFVSLRLAPPQINLYKAFKSAHNATTIGFYAFKSKKLYVRGTRATPGARAVLSHELTHALTDQWFGINRPKLDKGNQETGLAFTALIEGDAERTRLAYEKQMSPADRALAQKEENSGTATPHVPQIVLVILGFPYFIGPRFVDSVVAQGGIRALNNAYRHPPTSSEQLLDPSAYFNHDGPKHVSTPSADGTRLDHGDLGQILLLLMLEDGVDNTSAQMAVRGWGGDQYVSWRNPGGGWCLRDTVVMDNRIAQEHFQATLAEWVSKQNQTGHAQIEHSAPQSTTFTTCSPHSR